MTTSFDATDQEPSRRRFLVSASAVSALGTLGLVSRAFATPDAPLVTIEDFSASGESLGDSEVPKLEKTESEWRQILSPEQFEVARNAATERAYSGAYWNAREDGLYRCVCCRTALFDSRTKFDSDTGWPSFYRPISRENIIQTRDLKHHMRRTAVGCARCDAHLGHVFDDGPHPTGLRYCMNSASLLFVPRSV